MLELRRLTEVSPADLIALLNDPRVRRHLPLATGQVDEAACAAFVAAKERLWRDHGYGPWAFVLDGELAGWGGLQPEGDDADLALVLRPRFWGSGRLIGARILQHAFGELRLESVTMLLPPTRAAARVVTRWGFEPDGETAIDGERFLRYRLHAARWRHPGPLRSPA